MTSYGYMIFTFRVHRHGSRDYNLQLGDLFGASTPAGTPRSKTDAVVTLYGILHGLQGQLIDERNRHLGVASVQPAGRCIRFVAELGTSGQTSTFLDPDDAGRRVFDRADRHIETNQRRGLLVAPTNSVVGLLALESQSRSTGREQLAAVIKRGFRAHTGLIIDFDAVVHQDALQQFLAQAHVNAITLRRHGLPSDLAEQLEVRQPDAHLGRLEMTISRGRIPEFKQRLADKFRRDDNARDRLLSVGGLAFSEINVKMQMGERSTTLSVSADRMPSFVYHLSSTTPPSDEEFYGEVMSMVPDVARAFGAIVGADWQGGPWSEESLATVVPVPTQEVPDDGRTGAGPE
jgi:hypothetical protein